MSADPDAPADPNRLSGGHIIRNMIYRHDNAHNLEIVTGWKDQGVREYNQVLVPPARFDLPRAHPCSRLNAQVLRCSLDCPPEMKLAGRIASCNEERKALMVCLTRNKKWIEGENEGGTSAWYRFW